MIHPLDLMTVHFWCWFQVYVRNKLASKSNCCIYIWFYVTLLFCVRVICYSIY